jgi:hypothetical protein
MSFTYAGESVSAAFVAGVFNEVLAVATEKQHYADKRADDAIKMADNPYLMTAPAGTKPISVREHRGAGLSMINEDLIAPELSAFSTAGIDDALRALAQEISAKLIAEFERYFEVYFPLQDELMAGLSAWLEQALAGGTGVNPVVEAAIWSRDRERLLTDSRRAKDEATVQWASRGYPLPPGALVYAIELLDDDVRDKIAAQSRDVAIKAFEVEIANVRFAVTNIASLQSVAVNSASEYLKSIVLTPWTVGQNSAMAIVQAQAQFANATTDLFRAKIQAVDLARRLDVGNVDRDMKAGENNQGASTAAMKQRVDATISAAQSAGTQAAAALNGLRGSAAVGASESL